MANVTMKVIIIIFRGAKHPKKAFKKIPESLCNNNKIKTILAFCSILNPCTPQLHKGLQELKGEWQNKNKYEWVPHLPCEQWTGVSGSPHNAQCNKNISGEY